MDVSRIMRSLLGEVSGEPKALELKSGQVVRGVVLQLLEDREALLNIMGVPVRARLESPLAAGQTTLLQVLPESHSGVIHMRPLSVSSKELSTESMTNVLNTVGVKDTPTNRMIVRTLNEEGVPLTRQTVQAVAETVASGAGSQDDVEPLTRVAAAALQRGLEVNVDTVKALRTVLSGPPLNEVLRGLEAAANAASGSPDASESVKQAVARLLGVLQRTDALLGDTLRPGTHALQGGATATGAPPAGDAPASAPQQEGARASAPAGPGRAPAVGAEGLTAPRIGTPLTAAPPAVGGASGGGGTPPMTPPATGGGDRGAVAVLPPETPARAAAEALIGQAPERPPLASFFRLLGLDAERLWLRSAFGSPAEAEPQLNGAAKLAAAPSIERAPLQVRADFALLDAAPSSEPQASAAERPLHPAETLKSVLSQLAAADDTPPALKEAVQTALQHVTGQQLLMTPERSAPFTHLTLFVPLRSQDGSTDGSAAVHIHTRRGAKGELDADNCRLWFQLSLSTLGETWVDVQVANRAVGLQLWNDAPFIEGLLEESRDAIEEALRGIGYQLLTLQTSPMPERSTPEGEAAAGVSGKPSPHLANYMKSMYKGVDIRV